VNSLSGINLAAPGRIGGPEIVAGLERFRDMSIFTPAGEKREHGLCYETASNVPQLLRNISRIYLGYIAIPLVVVTPHFGQNDRLIEAASVYDFRTFCDKWPTGTVFASHSEAGFGDILSEFAFLSRLEKVGLKSNFDYESVLATANDRVAYAAERNSTEPGGIVKLFMLTPSFTVFWSFDIAEVFIEELVEQVWFEQRIRAFTQK